MYQSVRHGSVTEASRHATRPDDWVTLRRRKVSLIDNITCMVNGRSMEVPKLCEENPIGVLSYNAVVKIE